MTRHALTTGVTPRRVFATVSSTNTAEGTESTTVAADTAAAATADTTESTTAGAGTADARPTQDVRHVAERTLADTTTATAAAAAVTTKRDKFLRDRLRSARRLALQSKSNRHTIAGGEGFAFRAQRGTKFVVTDVSGAQVVDMVAWPLSSPSSSVSSLLSVLPSSPLTPTSSTVSSSSSSPSRNSEEEEFRIKSGEIELNSSSIKAKLPNEHLSTSVTRYRLSGNPPMVDECLYTNAFRPLLRLLRDTCGTHDMNYMCCSPEMYKLMGIDNHSSCAVNICNAVNDYFASGEKTGSSTTHAHSDALDVEIQDNGKKQEDKKPKEGEKKVMQSHLQVPEPFKTFQNTPNYSLKARATSRKGDTVEWEVLEDSLVALSACPYTIFNFNGGKATDIDVTWDQPLENQ